MQDRPTAAELLDALAEYLYAELRPHVPPEQRFKTLVAANVSAIVAREIRAGDEPSHEDLALFAELMGTNAGDAAVGGPEAARDAARELAATIRRGELDDRIDEVAARLRDHVARKLEIARPGYTGA